MNKRVKRGLFLGALVLAVQFVLAEELTSLADFYDQDKLERTLFQSSGAGDLSVEFLELLFGAVGGLNGQNVIMGEIFRAFNYGILSLVSFMVGYTVVASVMGAAQDGTGAFSSRVSPWSLVRTTTGVTIMFPLTNGYSLIQIMVMKIVLLGVALANTAWDATLVYYQETGGAGVVVSQHQSPNVKKNTVVMGDYYSDVYGKIWNAYDDLCKGKENCRVDFNIEEMLLRSGNPSIVLPITLTKGGKTKKILLVPPLPQTAVGANYWTNYWYATKQARMLAAPTLRRLFRDVQDHYNHPFYIVDKESLQPGQNVSRWEESHSCSMWVPKENKDHICRQQAERMALLGQTIALAAYEYALGVEAAVAPFLVKEGLSGEDWIDTAKQKGWLSSGMYYSHLMSHADEDGGDVPTFQINVNVMEEGERQLVEYDEKYAPGDQQVTLPQIVSVYRAQWSDKIGKVSNAPDTNDFLKAAFKGKSPEDSDMLRNRLREVLDGDNGDRDVLKYLRMLRPYMNRTHETFNLLPPNMSGSIDNAAAKGPQWLWGLDPTLPIQYMTRMMVRVLESLIGLKQTIEGSPGCEFYKTDAKLTDFFPTKNCFIRGSLLYTVLYPLDNVNPIVMIKGLGQQMIKQSVQYYHKTIEGLFKQTEKMANSFFRDSSIINVTAVAVETATYGSTAAPAGVLASTVAEIAVAGLKMGYNGTKVAMEIYVPLGTAIAATFFTLGIVLGVYLPMLPFLLFLFGAVAWLMSVAEAMVAAPLVALGVTHPEGHDLLGKAEQSLMLFLGVFIRPITMLFGILMAIIISQILLKLFHLGFVSVVFSMLPNPEETVDLTRLGIILIGALLVYIYVLMNVIEQSYSLIYQIPERILRWVGGPQDQTGIAQLAEQTKGETQQAAGQAAQGAGQATAAPQLQPTEASIQRAPEQDLGDSEDDKGGGDTGTQAQGSNSQGSGQGGGNASGSKGGGKGGGNASGSKGKGGGGVKGSK